MELAASPQDTRRFVVVFPRFRPLANALFVVRETEVRDAHQSRILELHGRAESLVVVQIHAGQRIGSPLWRGDLFANAAIAAIEDD